VLTFPIPTAASELAERPDDRTKSDGDTLVLELFAHVL